MTSNPAVIQQIIPEHLMYIYFIKQLCGHLSVSTTIPKKDLEKYQQLIDAALKIDYPIMNIGNNQFALPKPDKGQYQPVDNEISKFIKSDYAISENDENFYHHRLSIRQYNELIYLRDDSYLANDKVIFILMGIDVPEVRILLSQVEASLLYFIMAERKNTSSNWLINPNKYNDVIEHIGTIFTLPIEYYTWEDNKTTWINDFRNNYRRSIVTRINKKVKNRVNIKDNLIVNVNASMTKKGTYTIYKSVQSIRF